MELHELRDRGAAVLDEIERAVVGKRDALELILLALLSDGHVLLEDYPGLAKTLIARSFAQATSLQFSRIQFTPDLMPSDVTGSSIFDQRAHRVHVPARADLHEPPARRRDQPRPAEDAGGAARGDAGAPGDDRGRDARRSSAPFIVLATQNPIEYEGTYPLPEAQLDRFLLRIGVGYPSREHEIEMLARRIERGDDEVELEPVVDTATLVAMQRALEHVHVVGSDRGLHRRPRRGDARVEAPRGRREPARQPRAAEALACEGGARGPRLRRPRGREGDRGARARAPAHAPPGALGAAGARRGRRRRGARDGADAARRGRAPRRRMTPARLAAARRVRGLAARRTRSPASSLGRVELVALAAPFALAAVAGAALARRAGAHGRRSTLDRERALEGEDVARDARALVAGRRRPGRRLPAAPDELRARDAEPRAVALASGASPHRRA